jgi:hypothetical protein
MRQLHSLELAQARMDLSLFLLWGRLEGMRVYGCCRFTQELRESESSAIADWPALVDNEAKVLLVSDRQRWLLLRSHSSSLPVMNATQASQNK